MKLLPLAGLGAAIALMLSGCGGATTNGTPLAPTKDAGPVIYGVNALALISGATTGETSGLSFTGADGTTTGAVIGATAYTTVTGAGPLDVYQASFPNTDLIPPSSPGVPLGFSPDGTYYNVGAPVAAVPTDYAGNLTFGAYISTGSQNTRPVDLNTSSVVLTSSEAPGFSQPLTFDPNFGSGVLAQAQYKTAAFAMPAFLKTTGLHNLHTTVSDVGNPVQTSTTDFSVATVAPTDVALFLQSITVLVPATATAVAKTTTTAITPGDTVTIDGGQGIGVYPTSYTPKIADAQGTVIFFVTPGTHTVTETDSDGAVVQTETFTLTSDAAGTTLLAPPDPDGAPAASARPRVVHPSAKRTAKRVAKH